MSHLRIHRPEDHDPRETGEEAASLPGDIGALAAGGPLELEAILEAWNTATDRLQRTQDTLRAQLERLTAELAEKNEELARRKRLADLGQMASHVAHEVRNGLMPLTLYLSLLRRRVGEDLGSLTILDKVEAGFTALEATVNDLLHFSSQRDPQWRVFELRTLVGDVCQSLAPQFEAQGIALELDIPAGMEVSADAGMLRRAVLNLLLNALDAMPQGGELTLTGWEGPRGVELEIADSGPGLHEEQLERVFEPFFTTKEGGTGLGLAIVSRIAHAHGGFIRAQNCPQGGAAFTILIPRRAWEAAA